MPRLESRTSSPSRSIWLNLCEDDFRKHLVDLEKHTNAVPIEPQVFFSNDDVGKHNRLLPLHVEQQIADDFAFLAAIEEGAQSVAAVCVEEHTQSAGLTLRFAALDLSLSGDVKLALQHITGGLVSTTRSLDDSTQVDTLFDRVVRLHFRRLLARLRSDKWEKPKYLSRQHKKPLWQGFENLIHRVQFLYTKKEGALRRSTEAKLRDLAAPYEAFETAKPGSQDEFLLLQQLIKTSHHICKTADIAEYAQRLEKSVSTTPTSKVASAMKCLRQIEKIAAYWRIAASLVRTSREYSTLFKVKPQLAFLTPYKSVPTTIGYEAWATSCHVHAEVQLAVYYDLLLQSVSCTTETKADLNAIAGFDFHHPRIIGTSKWLCYLCYHFLLAHGGFFPTNTHGRLYDQWTLPDLAEYGEELSIRYRSIVHAMNKTVIEETNNTGPTKADGLGLVRWRAEPMTSRQNLISVSNTSVDIQSAHGGL